MSIECSHVCSVDYHPQKQHILVRVELCDPHYNVHACEIDKLQFHKKKNLSYLILDTKVKKA